MQGRRQPSVSWRRQRGAALLIFMLIAVIASLSLLLNRLASRASASNQQATLDTMALARDAIIGWSAARSSTPGMLPCPENTAFIGDPDNEGTAQTSCGNGVKIGRLPWRTLNVPQLRDDAGEPLWYAISPGFRTGIINANNAAQLSVDGIENRAVAIIFSPGAALAGQSRPPLTSASPPATADYLDDINRNEATLSFVSTGTPGLFNDRLLTITRENLFSVVNHRILSEIRGDEGWGLQKYHVDNNKYPWASADTVGAPADLQQTPFLPHSELAILATVNTNHWYPLVTYGVDADRQKVTLAINVPTRVSCTIIPGQPICQ